MNLEIKLGNVRGPAGLSELDESIKVKDIPVGQFLFNNGGTLGGKELDASAVGALPFDGTAEKANKLTKNGIDFEAWQLQMQNGESSPYNWYTFGKYSDAIGGFVLKASEGKNNDLPVSAGKLQCKNAEGVYYDWAIDSIFDIQTGKFFLLARQTGKSEIGVMVDLAKQVASSSSIRYKEDVHAVGDDLLDSILNLDVIDFIYNSDAPEHVRDEKRHYGMIAEQVVKVIPDSVTLDREGFPAAVVYSDFIPLLLAQLKRQQKQMDALEQRIRKLEEGNRE